ncbi:MAG: 50S ribosomal protein L22 [Holosporales bacterium]|jgi:large subunit ribosomal protein L22|nr:50S ribosomal protein L22 [Holosporales bacterium]
MAKRLHLTHKSTLVTARSRFVKSSPRKVNLIASMIRGKTVAKALGALAFCEKSSAGDVYKTLKSAIANAENNCGLDVDLLIVSEAYVGKATTLRRWKAGAFGKARPILKRSSNLTIVVGEVEG